jgi:hypothetical protein
MSVISATGYSGTPLAKKLGIKEGSRVFVSGAPKDYRRLLAPLPARVSFEQEPGSGVDLAHVFVTQQLELSALLKSLRKRLNDHAALWVSWPKKAAKMAVTVTEGDIRALALPLGYVDVKVCAVNEIWSGLKLVVRKELR